MKIERHVFGSRHGYQTLAQSDGITSREREELESYSFGQTNDASYLGSLGETPAYICRPLGSTRRTLTRVLPGEPDDQGRTTLLFVSAIFDNTDWVQGLRGDVGPLLQQASLWQWDGDPQIDSLALSPASSGPKRFSLPDPSILLQLLSQAEHAVQTGRTLVADERAVTPGLLRLLPMLIPDEAKPGFSIGVRTLSSKLRVSVNLLAAQAGQSNRSYGTPFQPQTDQPLSPYTQHLIEMGLHEGTIPWDIVHRGRWFPEPAQATAESPSGPSTMPQSSKCISRWPKIVAGLILVIVVAASGLAIGQWMGNATPDNRSTTSALDEGQDVPTPSDDRKKAMRLEASIIKGLRELSLADADDLEWHDRVHYLRMDLQEYRRLADSHQEALADFFEEYLDYRDNQRFNLWILDPLPQDTDGSPQANDSSSTEQPSDPRSDPQSR